MRIAQIYEGWKNSLLPAEELKEQIALARSTRMQMCEACPNHSKNHKTVRPDAHCIACGCTLSAKTACLSCHCPIHKWEAEVVDEYDEKIKEFENGREN